MAFFLLVAIQIATYRSSYHRMTWYGCPITMVTTQYSKGMIVAAIVSHQLDHMDTTHTKNSTYLIYMITMDTTTPHLHIQTSHMRYSAYSCTQL